MDNSPACAPSEQPGDAARDTQPDDVSHLPPPAGSSPPPSPPELEQAQSRFRQGSPSLTLHEKIRLRSDALHWLGKAEDHREQPGMAQYLFSIYLDECINAFYYLRGFWLPSAKESLPFIAQRDPALGDLLQQALAAPELPHRIDLGLRMAEPLFTELASPARID